MTFTYFYLESNKIRVKMAIKSTVNFQHYKRTNAHCKTQQHLKANALHKAHKKRMRQ